MSTVEQLVRTLFDRVFTSRDLDLLDAMVATEFTEHAVAPFGAEPPGRVDGPSHMRGVVEWLVGQYPDLVMRIDALVAAHDMVAARVTSEGTNLGPLNGVIPPTGKRFRNEASHWYRIADGKLVEHWATRDDLTAMLQLGVVGPTLPETRA
jgi:predicted ester cyclase